MFILFGNFKTIGFCGRLVKRFCARFFMGSARFELVHKFDDSAPGNLLSNQKKTTMEISLISLLHFLS